MQKTRTKFVSNLKTTPRTYLFCGNGWPPSSSAQELSVLPPHPLWCVRPQLEGIDVETT